jgi:hypothetical protein
MLKATLPAPAPSGVARLASLFLLSASTLWFEVLLTKLFANKLEHHYTFAIIALALLGYGGSGVLVQLKRGVFLPDGRASGRWLWRFMLAWCISLLAVVPLFLLLPLDPAVPGPWGAIALPVYFVLFAGPFFLAGVPVAALLMSSEFQPSRVYFWDLLGAAAGAALGPVLLGPAGAYGSVVLAALLAFAAAVTALLAERRGGFVRCALASVVVLAGSAACLALPAALRHALGFDMVSFKALIVKADFIKFGAPVMTFWNAIARLDVSPTAASATMSFRYGLPKERWDDPLMGRLILVDGGANSRQYLLDRHPRDAEFLKSALWAAPYVARQGAQRALIIGAGGGVDILVGKAFGVREIDALELNPDMARLLAGRPEDRQRQAYATYLGTDEATRVDIHNVEARHFARRHRGKRTYSIVVASGVDTLTAIQSSGNSLSENFLYTADAVQDYVALLEPGGVLALTHWHLEPPRHALKMFATYLQVLEQSGAQHPARHVCVVSDAMAETFSWESSLLKKDQEFTLAEVTALRAFARSSGFQVIWEPFMADDEPVRRPGDLLFRQLGRAERSERARLMQELPFDVTPSSDDRPYFYWVNNRAQGDTQYDGNWVYGEALFPQESMTWMLRLALLLSAGLAVGPAVVMLRRGRALREIAGPLPFFAMTGLAFVLAENAIFLLVTLFVGGPLYSLSVVLPSILGGYGIGSLLSGRIAAQGRRSAALLTALCVLGFGGFAAVAFGAFPPLITLGQPLRMALSVAAVTPFAMVLGMFVPWYMSREKAGTAEPALAWMWSLSALGNVLGSLLFVPICHAIGARAVFAAAALLYLLALAWAAVLAPTTSPAQEAA